MFPFNTLFSSFSPFFLKKNWDLFSLWRAMGYYFATWWVVLLTFASISVTLLWFFVTPEVVSRWLQHIPVFSFTTKDGILTETAFSEDPFVLVDQPDFVILFSKNLTQIPQERQKISGIYILKDKVIISQKTWWQDQEQIITYADVEELKNTHFDNKTLETTLRNHLPEIKNWLSKIYIFIVFFLGIFMSIWYCAWSFFWGFFIWIFWQKSRSLVTYEKSVCFILYTFFPVLFVSIIFMIFGIYFPFLMTALFLLMLWYNHLSFYKGEWEQ